MSYDVCRREELVKYISTKKWECRLKGESYNRTFDKNVCGLVTKCKNLVKNLPKEAALYSNLLCAMCPKCIGRRMDADHLESAHSMKVDSLREAVEKVHVLVDKGMAKCPRKERINFTTNLFTSKINVLRRFMAS